MIRIVLLQSQDTSWNRHFFRSASVITFPVGVALAALRNNPGETFQCAP